MLTGDLKASVNSLWNEFWTGGITNPLTVIEQITFLMYARLLDMNETRDENQRARTGKSFKPRFGPEEQHLRWSQFRHMGNAEKLPLVRDKVFPHLRKASLDGTTFSEFMKDAQLMIQKESLLGKAIDMIQLLPLTDGDTKGDLYEFLLSRLTTAGINGQFRTPRHIIRMMVEMLDPKKTETVCDPSCGTGGFLVGVMEHILRENTSPEMITRGLDVNGKPFENYVGDELLPEDWDHIRGQMFNGFDFDATMLRIAAMNLTLHGVDDPGIHYQDTLSNGFPEKFPTKATEGYDIVLANPPFKGSLDFEDVHSGLLRAVKTRKTELLFLVLILRMLKRGGRSATIVPDGVLFGSSTAHVALRRLLLDENQLEAVISLPSGVFKPYAGVSTGILVFTKGGRTDDVFFYDVEADGFSLDDKRDPIEADDLPECLAAWQNRDAGRDTDRTQKAFFVSAQEIRDTNYDLSLGKYKERVHVAQTYDSPAVILDRVKKLNDDIASDLAELEELLG